MIEGNKEANLNLFQYLYDKRKQFIIVTILAIVLAVITVFLTPKKYASTGIVYAVPSNSYDRTIDNPGFGDEDDADQLVQLFKSNSVKEKLNKQFDLVSYYELDTNDLKWRYLLYKNMDGDISFNRTRYASVEISAETKSPELSANMVNYIIDLIDSERKTVYSTNVDNIVAHYQSEYNLKNTEVGKVLDTLYSIAGNGSGSNNRLFANRNKFMDERQRNAHVLPADEAIKRIKGSNQTMEVELLINQYYFLQGRLNFIKEKLDRAELKQKMPVNSVYTVSKAQANYKKTSPKLSLYLIGFILGGLFLTVFLGLFLEEFKKLKK